jgi:hypothetical protein
MAHFAELESKTDPTGFTSDTHLVVKKVVVVDNEHVPSDGNKHLIIIILENNTVAQVIHITHQKINF